MSDQESRIARLETAVESLSKVLEREARSRSEWEERVENKLDHISEGKPTEWGVIVSGISVAIVIGVLVLQPIYKELISLDAEIHRLRDSFKDAEKSLEKRVVDNFRREMKNINDRSQRRDDELTVWLQTIEASGTRVSQNGETKPLPPPTKSVD